MMNEAIFLEWRLMTVLSVAAMMACWKANPRGRWRRLRYYEPGAASVLGRNTQQAIYTVGSSGIVQGGGCKMQFLKSWHERQRLPLSVDFTEDY